MAASLQWRHHPLSFPPPRVNPRRVSTIKSFQRSDLEDFTKRLTSGESWKEGWRKANDSFEQFVFDAKKAAERIDRDYSVSKQFRSVTESAVDRAREIDREFEVGRRWRSFSVDFNRNLPKYRKQLSDFLGTPLGRTFSMVFFLWFALSGWLFQFVVVAIWVLPLAAFVLIRIVAKNFVIEGACPACKQRFVGYKNQMISCRSCGNVVWKPKSNNGGGGGSGRSSNRSSSGYDDNIIDVEFEEK